MKIPSVLVLAVWIGSAAASAAGDDDFRQRIRNAPPDATLHVTLENGEHFSGTLVDLEERRFRLYYALEQRADGGTERRTRWIPFEDIEELHVEGVDRIPDVTELPYRIRIGDYAHVHVLDDVLKGNIEALDGEVIRIENRTFRMDEVTKIDLREHDSLANGALIGFGVGAGLVGLACTQGGCSAIAVAAVVFYGGVGAGIGALIDSAATRYTTVYLGNQRNKTLHVSPLITPDAKGLLISVRF